MAPFARLVLADLEPEGDVVDDAPVRQQPEVLEDHREATPAQLAEPLLVRGTDVLAVEEDLAQGRLDQPGEAADERRLAAARQAHDDEDLARADVERDVADGDRGRGPEPELGIRELEQGRTGDLRLGRPEDLPQPTNGDRRLARCVVCCPIGLRGLHAFHLRRAAGTPAGDRGVGGTG